MGVILDSSVLIAGERGKQSVREILERVKSAHGELDCALSFVAVVELTHWIYRAKSQGDRERRRAFCDELRHHVVVHSVTIKIAELAGRIEGEQAARGVSLAFEDLLIGATAVHLGYGVATVHVRNFQNPRPFRDPTLNDPARSNFRARYLAAHRDVLPERRRISRCNYGAGVNTPPRVPSHKMSTAIQS